MSTVTFNYSRNWNNKLLLDGYFTTIRIFNPAKHVVGVYAINNLIKSKNEIITFSTEIVSVHPMMLDQIPEFVYLLDTGYSKNESIKMFEQMYKTKELDVHKVKFAIITHKHRPDLDQKLPKSA